jgi:hypothetical protein
LAKKARVWQPGKVAGVGCQTLACALAVMVLRHSRLKHNGSLSNNHLLMVKTGEIKPDLDLLKIL